MREDGNIRRDHASVIAQAEQPSVLSVSEEANLLNVRPAHKGAAAAKAGNRVIIGNQNPAVVRQPIILKIAGAYKLLHPRPGIGIKLRFRMWIPLLLPSSDGGNDRTVLFEAKNLASHRTDLNDIRPGIDPGVELLAQVFLQPSRADSAVGQQRDQTAVAVSASYNVHNLRRTFGRSGPPHGGSCGGGRREREQNGQDQRDGGYPPAAACFPV